MPFSPMIAEAYRRAPAPLTPVGLRDTFLTLVEQVLDGVGPRFRYSAEDEEDVLAHPATVPFAKELFNSYFRDELYGRYRDDAHVILSSGSPHEPTFPLADSLKSCIRMALDKDWYGYSDSRGRAASRQAVAALEEARVAGARITEANVALTIGGTFAAGCVFDFLLSGRIRSEPALCAVPNYAPLVASLANRSPVRLVETTTVGGFTDLSSLLDEVSATTPLVFLQTVTNPTGTRVRAEQLAELHHRIAPTTLLVLDEAHDCYGPDWQLPPCLAADNVIRIASLSKRLSIPGIKLGWIVAAESVIADYYEYASTMYGGPPSFFYLLIEMAARFERWASRPIAELSDVDLREFEPAYGLELPQLQSMFDDYSASDERRHRHIGRLRRQVVTELGRMDYDVTAAQYSVNVAARAPAGEDGWIYYRRLLADVGVAVFPGVLTMSFGDPLVRVTVARPDCEITEGLRRMKSLRAG